LTARLTADEFESAVQAHPLGWVQKPYSPESVIALVNSVLDERN
jgi:hypothetical protein